MSQSLRISFRSNLLRVFAGSLILFLALPLSAAVREVDFQRDVRPILSDNCFTCHGPDDSERKGKLRLDTRETFSKTSAGKVVVVPGKAAESELIKRLVTSDADDLMPPAKTKKILTPRQIEILTAWVNQGAKYDTHWAFTAPEKPKVPVPSGRKWIRNEIDAFVLARLEREGLSPAPEADRVTLIRRLSFDLTGLPPTPAEVDAFVKDRSKDAYERVVERLLKSPHHGERWARHWLDVARYADSDGFEKDKSREVWFYRDWVIRSMNNDLPYNEFIVDQLAGDLRPNPTQDQIVATGFLRNSMINEEGGVDPEQFRMDAMFDRMDCIGKGVLGLTIQCAQCHNHKYDPMTIGEYYGLFAFLNNDHEAQRVVYSPSEQMLIAELRREMASVESGLIERTPDWESQLEKWEGTLAPAGGGWSSIVVTNAGDHGQRYIPQKDGSVLAQGYAPTKFTTHMRGTTPLKQIGAFRLELLNDPNLPCNGPGRSFMGTCALTEFAVEAADAANPTNKVSLKFIKATADYGNPERDLEPNFYDKSDKKRVTGPVEFAIDGKDDTAWGIDAGPGRRNVPRQAVFVPEKPVQFAAGAILDFRLRQNHGGWNSDDHMNNNLGRFRLSVAEDRELSADPVPVAVRQILAVPKERRSAAQKRALFSYWRTTVPAFKEGNERIEALWNRWPGGSTALTLMARDEMRPTHLLKRGDWLKPEQQIGPGVPAFLNPFPSGKPANRLGFAEWLVDREAPTTARVLVNRVWQTYFGTGIVASPEDFGVQSEIPSHRELLDWLAVQFMDHGWSMKTLHRWIVTSATYRQSSKVDPSMLEKDPYNRLIARGSRFRVEGEIVRDIALSSSGLLNARIGGPSVFAPAPEFLFLPPASYAPFTWKEETGPDRYRRALYTFRRRSTPYPALQTFDAPNGDASCVRRLRSNTPLQALVAMNEPLFMECAQALARRMMEEGGENDADRIRYGFRQVLSRQPTRAEERELAGLLERQRRRISEGWVPAAELAGRRVEPAGKGTVPPTQLAAYTVVARVLLNLDETMTRE